MSAQSIPVLIVGAGPTGLNLANLLRQYGVQHRIIEKKPTPILTSNALAIQPRSLEMWDSMGIAEDAIARGKKIAGLSLSSSTKLIGQINVVNSHTATQFPFVLGLSQAESENLLAEHLKRKGGNVERGCSLFAFRQTEDRVETQVQHPNGNIERVDCEWLVAADGSHSAIRDRLDLNFRGATLPETFIMMDAIISADLAPDYIHATLSSLGPIVFIPLKHFTRIICTVTHDVGIKDFQNPTVADFDYVIKNRSRIPVKIIKSLWISHFVTHHRLIDSFCHKRILFAGDSAHIHSPVGGQGMNTGMQDTFNLAWKLALICKGKSQPKLLESYNTERRSVAKQVLARTTKMTQVVALNNRLLIALRNYLLGIFLRYKVIQNKIINQISELGVAYLPNKIILNNGKRAPDTLLYDSRNHAIQLRKLLHGSKHHLLIFSGNDVSNMKVNAILNLTHWVNENAAELFDIILILNTSNKDHVGSAVYFDSALTAHKTYSLPHGGICIVRPDQYIGLCRSQIKHDIIANYVAVICS